AAAAVLDGICGAGGRRGLLRAGARADRGGGHQRGDDPFLHGNLLVVTRAAAYPTASPPRTVARGARCASSDDLAPTIWLRRSGSDDLAPTIWLRRSGSHRSTERVARTGVPSVAELPPARRPGAL